MYRFLSLGRTLTPQFALFLLLLALTLSTAPVAVSAADSTTVGGLTGYSTLHSIGVELQITGDDNHNAVCTLKYRPAGGGVWKSALDLFRVDYTPPAPVAGLAADFNGFAGSVFFLLPGQSYELSLEINDPDGGSASRSLVISTRPQPRKPVQGRSFHVRPGNGGGDGSSGSPFLGIDAAQAQARPGDIFLLHAGAYSGFDSAGEIQLNVAGSNGNYIVWQAAGDGNVVLDAPLRIAADHLWIEGFHVRGHKKEANEYGLRTYGAPTDVVIKRNLFTD